MSSFRVYGQLHITFFRGYNTNMAIVDTTLAALCMGLEIGRNRLKVFCLECKVRIYGESENSVICVFMAKTFRTRRVKIRVCM